MEWQPELPPIKFVRAGCSAVHVALDELLEKLMSNPRITDKIRWLAPYDRGTKLVVYYMVILLVVIPSVYLTEHFILTQARISPSLFDYN